MTHILIPLDLIEKRIDLAKKEIKASDSNVNRKNCLKRKQFYEMLKEDKSLKKIDLSKLDKKAERKFNRIFKQSNPLFKEGYLEAYEQALTDLL